MANTDNGSKYERINQTRSSLKNLKSDFVNYNERLIDKSGKVLRGTSDQRSGSIISAAKGNIFEFPVFVSSSTPLEYATATNSLLEQVYASYLQMAVSVNPVVDSEVARSGGAFGAFKSNTNKYLEHTDMSYAHDACHAIYENDEYVTEFNMITASDLEYQIINEQCDYQPLSEFSHYFQEGGQRDYPAKKQKKNKNKGNKQNPVDDEPVKKEDTDNDNNTSSKDKSDDKVDKKPTGKDRWDQQKDRKDKDQTERDKQRQLLKDLRDKEDHKMKKEKHEADMDKNNKDRELTQKKIDSYDDEQKRAKEKHAVDKKIKSSQFIDESKIQKLNTMKPLLMSVNLGIMDKNGSISKQMEYVVGVKTHCRIIDAEILPEVAEYPIKEMDKIARKAKWRAGELKFFKDIVFKIKQKKQSAVDSRDPKRKWYRRLYELAHMTGDAPSSAIIENKSVVKTLWNRFVNKQGTSYGVMPNATIVITKSDVDNIKTQTNIDLLKGSTAVKFCKELFLISLVVIDNDAESVKILLPDLHNDFEIHSIASINKQLAMLDTAGSKTRDILKVLG